MGAHSARRPGLPSGSTTSSATFRSGGGGPQDGAPPHGDRVAEPTKNLHRLDRSLRLKPRATSAGRPGHRHPSLGYRSHHRHDSPWPVSRPHRAPGCQGARRPESGGLLLDARRVRGRRGSGARLAVALASPATSGVWSGEGAPPARHDGRNTTLRSPSEDPHDLTKRWPGGSRHDGTAPGPGAAVWPTTRVRCSLRRRSARRLCSRADPKRSGDCRSSGLGGNAGFSPDIRKRA